MTILGTQSQTSQFLGNGGRKFINPPSQEAWEATRIYCDAHNLPVVYRHHWPEHDQVYRDDPEIRGREVARQLIDELRQYPRWPRNLYVCGYNEVVLESAEAARLYARFTVALAEELAQGGLRLAAFSFSVGNPALWIWPYLYDAMRAVHRLGGVIDVHEYYLSEVGPLAEDQLTWTFGRCRRVWEMLPNDLKTIGWYGGETGLDRAGNGLNDGFRARIGPALYADHLRQIGRHLIALRREGMRILEYHIFISGNDGVWPSFELLGGGQDLLEAAINQVNEESKEEPPVVILLECEIVPEQIAEGGSGVIIARVYVDGQPRPGTAVAGKIMFPHLEQAFNELTGAGGMVDIPFVCRDSQPLSPGIEVPVEVWAIWSGDGVSKTISFRVGGGKVPEDRNKTQLVNMWQRQGANPNTDTDPFFAYCLEQAKTSGRAIVPMQSPDGNYLDYSDPEVIICYTIPPLWARKPDGPIMEGLPRLPLA